MVHEIKNLKNDNSKGNSPYETYSKPVSNKKRINKNRKNQYKDKELLKDSKWQ